MLIAWSQGQGSGAATPVSSGVSIRQRIFDAVAARFATVLVINGYTLNIGSNVFEWKPEVWLQSEMPGVDLRDEEAGDTLAMGQEIHTLRIHARCLLSNGTTTMDDVRKAKADVTTMVAVDVTWGGLAQNTGMVTARLAEFEQAEYKFSGVDVTFDIEYTTEIGNPYS